MNVFLINHDEFSDDQILLFKTWIHTLDIFLTENANEIAGRILLYTYFINTILFLQKFTQTEDATNTII